MKKTAITLIAVVLLLGLFAASALAVSGDLTIRDVKAYSDAAMTQPVGTIPAGTSVLVRSHDGFADLYVDGKVVYISASALLNRDVTSDYAASLGKGVRVYQQASTSADSIKLPKEVTVNICAVNGDWALVQTTNKAGIYGYVRVDRLSDIHLK